MKQEKLIKYVNKRQCPGRDDCNKGTPLVGVSYTFEPCSSPDEREGRVGSGDREARREERPHRYSSLRRVCTRPPPHNANNVPAACRGRQGRQSEINSKRDRHRHTQTYIHRENELLWSCLFEHILYDGGRALSHSNTGGQTKNSNGLFSTE